MKKYWNVQIMSIKSNTNITLNGNSKHFNYKA